MRQLVGTTAFYVGRAWFALTAGGDRVLAHVPWYERKNR